MQRIAIILHLLLLTFGGGSSGTKAQSLAVLKERPTNFLLEAQSPTNIGYRIEASADLGNWLVASDQASGTFRLRFAPTNGIQFFRLNTWITDDLPITVVSLGDSTVADYAANSEQFCGWGQGMHDNFRPNVRYFNLAMPLESSRSFPISMQRENMLRIKPEFVFVQFGAVDSYGMEGHTTTMPEYATNLKAIIHTIRNIQATPILVTPPAVRYFDSQGKVAPPEWLVQRCEVVRKVATETQTYLVDLNASSTALLNQLGPAGIAFMAPNGIDLGHFSFAGAEVIADLVMEDLPAILRSQAASP
ncbi:MAG TPA: GDSL-type esterase/lipase family protein [Verrucomicrobiae bacterium]